MQEGDSITIPRYWEVRSRSLYQGFLDLDVRYFSVAPPTKYALVIRVLLISHVRSMRSYVS